MSAIITDTFDYDDIVRVLDLDEAFVHHQIDALQPKYWRIVIKTKPKGLKIFAPVMVSGNRGIDYMIYMLSRDWQITKKQRLTPGYAQDGSDEGLDHEELPSQFRCTRQREIP